MTGRRVSITNRLLSVLGVLTFAAVLVFWSQLPHWVMVTLIVLGCVVGYCLLMALLWWLLLGALRRRNRPRPMPTDRGGHVRPLPRHCQRRPDGQHPDT